MVRLGEERCPSSVSSPFCTRAGVAVRLVYLAFFVNRGDMVETWEGREGYGYSYYSGLGISWNLLATLASDIEMERRNLS